MIRLFSLMSLILITTFASVPFVNASLTVQAQDAYTAYWDGQSRFTVLVMGMDRRPTEHNSLEVRTDAMMLISYDPRTEQIGILSIPRDMHFPLVENGELVRVNTLMMRGEHIEKGYGPIYAMDTLQYNFGLYIDAYILFDFNAFITFVDAIGGITVDVPIAIYDSLFPDLEYGYDPLEIERGLQTLDGYDALRYARTRHGDSDYMRVQRQIAVVKATFEKLQEPETLNNIVENAPDLLAELTNSLYTNIAPQDAIRLGLEMADLSVEDISSGSLDTSYSTVVNLGTGTVRVPDRSLLPELLTEVFGTNYVG
ncbi:LCP family protein [Phototrophicus methaneseepsis]|uniref:LCP family protein n=1 Tax=Phototrophicus methaneseepsis TaxID=2710758 RepID=A0A7S8E934_9CHLR|nr:LCP family protein [Phototrophicus methaneseepsis]QPC82504.1 LCP family protein [Phototrophicus methaneseepsis]